MRHFQRSPRGGGRRLALRAPTVALLVLTVTVPVGLAPAAADEPTDQPLPAAAGWLVDQLDATPDPTPVQLADTVLALAATGSARDTAGAAYAELAALGDRALTTPGDAAKSLLAAAAQDAVATPFGQAAETALRADADEAGRFPYGVSGQTQHFVQSLAVLALETTVTGAPEQAVDFLVAGACTDDGSYRFPGGCPGGDIDTTAVAAQALRAVGEPADAQIAWLLDQQAPDGSFGVGGDANTNSTALAAQALRDAGETEAADAALAWVVGQQRGCDAPVGDRGSFATYTDAAGDVVLATSQAVFAASPAMHQLDTASASADTAYLNCSDRICPDGVSVAVDLTTLAPDRQPEVRCITDLAAGADGLDVLRAAGFEVVTAEFDFGSGPEEFVCSIDGYPQLPEGECSAADGYLAYWNADVAGDWTAYGVGADSSQPAPGTIEGWAWAADFADVTPRVSTTPAAFGTPFDRGIDLACPDTYGDPFDDVAGTTHASSIRCIVAGGITSGTADPDRYAPVQPVTRGQLATFLARAYQAATGAQLPTGADGFGDDDGSVHEDNIDRIAAAGVVAGVSDGRFAPDRTVSRGQAATMLDRFLDVLDGEVDRSFPAATTASFFTDVAGTTHSAAIERTASHGLVQGQADGSYRPIDGVSRGQMATFVARALDLAVETGYADPVD